MPRIARDPLAIRTDYVTAQGNKVRQITKSDTDDLLEVPKALLILTDGNICVEPANGYEQENGAAIAGGIVHAVTAGQVFDLYRIRRLYSTGTTATALAIL